LPCFCQRFQPRQWRKRQDLRNLFNRRHARIAGLDCRDHFSKALVAFIEQDDPKILGYRSKSIPVDFDIQPIRNISRNQVDGYETLEHENATPLQRGRVRCGGVRHGPGPEPGVERHIHLGAVLSVPSCTEARGTRRRNAECVASIHAGLLPPPKRGARDCERFNVLVSTRCACERAARSSLP